MAGRPGRTPSQSAAAARKGKPASGAARAVAKPTMLGWAFARPGMIVAGASFAAVMTGIVANALILQKGHHPSPLFSPAVTETAQPVPLPPPAPRQALEPPAVAPEPAVPATVPAVEAPPAPLAKPVTAPAPHAAAKKAAIHPAPAHPAAAHKDAAAAPHKPAAPHPDPIGQLLGKAQ